MGYKVLNNAFSTLAGSITGSATSLTVATGHGDRFPVISGADYTYITLEDSLGHIEIVKVTARTTASDIFTIVRAQDGTTARAWAVGDIVELRIIAALLDMAIAHVDDTTAAHMASSIGNTPAGNIAATTVQAALNELDTELSALISTANANLTSHLNDTIDAHDASAISYLGSTNLASTDVEAALDELDTEKAALAGATFTGGINLARGSLAMHATTMNLWGQGNIIDGTGSSVIMTAIANAPQAGATRKLYPIAGTKVTHGATFDVEGNADYTAVAGDAFIFEAITTNTYKVWIDKDDGTPAVSASGVVAGTIIDFGGSAAPSGYLACDGASYLRATYPTLFSAIGTLWGSVDGTHFNVPNFLSGIAAVQNAGVVGASTHGSVIAHTHSGVKVPGSQGGAASVGHYGDGSTASTGGTDNLAAGMYVFKCIKT